VNVVEWRAGCSGKWRLVRSAAQYEVKEVQQVLKCRDMFQSRVEEGWCELICSMKLVKA